MTCSCFASSLVDEKKLCPRPLFLYSVISWLKLENNFGDLSSSYGLIIAFSRFILCFFSCQRNSNWIVMQVNMAKFMEKNKLKHIDVDFKVVFLEANYKNFQKIEI